MKFEYKSIYIEECKEWKQKIVNLGRFDGFYNKSQAYNLKIKMLTVDDDVACKKLNNTPLFGDGSLSMDKIRKILTPEDIPIFDRPDIFVMETETGENYVKVLYSLLYGKTNIDEYNDWIFDLPLDVFRCQCLFLLPNVHVISPMWGLSYANHYLIDYYMSRL